MSAADRILASLETKRLRRTWNPDLHPRDSKGRFVETGGIARLWGGGMARVLRALGGRDVLVENLATHQRSRINASRLTMVARPDGSAPTKSKAKVRDEDARRLGDRNRGAGFWHFDPEKDEGPAPDHPADDDEHNDRGDNGLTPDDPHERDDQGDPIGEDIEGQDLGAGPDDPDDDDDEPMVPQGRVMSNEHDADGNLLPANRRGNVQRRNFPDLLRIADVGGFDDRGGSDRARHVAGNGDALRAAGPKDRTDQAGHRFWDTNHARRAVHDLEEEYFGDLEDVWPADWNNAEADRLWDELQEYGLGPDVGDDKNDQLDPDDVEKLPWLADNADELSKLAHDDGRDEVARYAANLRDALNLLHTRFTAHGAKPIPKPGKKRAKNQPLVPRAWRADGTIGTNYTTSHAQPGNKPARGKGGKRFASLADLQQHWQSGNLEPYTADKAAQQRHQKETAALFGKLDKPQLSRNGTFVVAKMTVEKDGKRKSGYAVIVSGSGVRLAMSERKGEALDFANRLETAQLDGKPFDWDSPGYHQRLESEAGQAMVRQASVEAKKAFADKAAKKRQGAAARNTPAPATPVGGAPASPSERPSPLVQAARQIADASGAPPQNIAVGHVGPDDDSSDGSRFTKPGNTGELREYWKSGGDPALPESTRQSMRTIANRSDWKLTMADHRGFAVIQRGPERFDVLRAYDGRGIGSTGSAGFGFKTEADASLFTMLLGREVEEPSRPGQQVDWWDPELATRNRARVSPWRKDFAERMDDIRGRFDIEHGEPDSYYAQEYRKHQEERNQQPAPTAPAAAGTPEARQAPNAPEQNTPQPTPEADRPAPDVPQQTPEQRDWSQVPREELDTAHARAMRDWADGEYDDDREKAARAEAEAEAIVAEAQRRDTEAYAPQLSRIRLGSLNMNGLPVSIDGDDERTATLKGSAGRWKWNRSGHRTRYSSDRSFLTREAALADLVREHDAERDAVDRQQAEDQEQVQQRNLASMAAATAARQQVMDALDAAEQQLLPVVNSLAQAHGEQAARDLAGRAVGATERLRDGESEPSEAIQEFQAALDSMQRATRGLDGRDNIYVQRLLRLARENVGAARQALADQQKRSDNGGVRGSRPDVLADVPAQRGGGDPDERGVRGVRPAAVGGDRGGDQRPDGRVGAAAEGGDRRGGARSRAEVGADAGPGAGAARDGLRDAEGAGDGGEGHAEGGAAPAVAPQDAERSAGATPSSAAASWLKRVKFGAATAFEPPPGGDTLAPSSPRNRAKANIAAIEILHRLDAEDRPATPEEQQELARYSGWGAVPQIFKPRPDEQFAPLAARLRELLTDQEWADAKANTLNAHYTDPQIVQQVWAAVQGLGFDGGSVLEPGSGIGNFIGYAPDGADMTGVEIDPVTARIAKALYPHAEVRHESFGETRAPNGTFDLAIGNVPFGRYKVPDLVHNKGGHSIHNHFILKSLDLTRGGGLVAVVTSALTMDGHGKRAETARMEMAEKAELVGAIRLPSGAHQRTAGTSVMTDLLIFRRREKDKTFTSGRTRKGEVKHPSERSQNDPPMWVHSLPRFGLPGQTDPGKDNQAQPVFYNSYFHDHPEQVLGKLAVGHGLNRDNELRVDGDGNTIANLNRALKRTVDAARDAGLGYQAAPEDRRQVTLLPPGSGRVDGHVQAEPDGTFTQVRDGMVHPFPVPQKQADEARRLLAIRDTFQSLLAEESRKDADDSLIEQLRAALNEQYDAYFQKYKAINRFTWAKRTATDPDSGEQVQKAYRKKAPRGGLFSKDPTMANISPLDEYDDNTGHTTKAAIFTKRQGKYREIAEHADDPQDALAIVLEQDGTLTADGLARVMNTDGEDAVGRLLAARSVDPDTGVEYPLAFRAPDGKLVTAADYLSGNVREKLAAAREAAADDPAFDVNVENLELVVPPDLSTGEIAAPMGASWIGREAVEQFLRETLGSDQIKVSWQGGALWTVDAPDAVKKSIAYRTRDTWSAPGYDAVKLAEAILTNRKITVSKKVRAGGKEYSEFDPQATEDAKTKADLLKEAFTDWLWAEPDRAEKYKRLYNDNYNSMAPRSYDGQRRTIPGLVEWFKPHPHQHAAVARMVNEPSVLLAHEVGAGKTAEMAMGVMELRRLGLIKKAALVVPGHMLEQFRHEFAELFPESVANNRILTASSDDLAGKGRREFISRAAAGDYDAIILTQTAFESIQMRPEVQEAYITRRLERLEDKIFKQQALDGEDNDTRLVKRMQNQLKALKEKLDKKLSGLKDDAGLHFEDMGIDYLVVDEAHMYKNLDTPSSIAAIDGANRASDLEMKLEWLREQSATGRVVTFATATPVANSIAEVHTMMRYLRPDLLQQLGMMDFDDFASTFAQMVSSIERGADGSYTEKVRLAAFQNVPELLRLWRTFADVKTSEDLDLPVPGVAGGKAVTITMPMSEAQEAYEETIKARAAALSGGNVDPREDNHLKLLNDGRLAALDPRLIDPAMGSGNKLPTVADNVHRIYEQTKDAQYPTDPKTDPSPHPTPGGLQIVFLDLGTPKDPGRSKKRKKAAGAEGAAAEGADAAASEGGEAYTDFSTYDELKKLLVARGIPSEKIRFIHEAKDDAAKARLFHDARTGKVAVLLGSTAKMGTGTNVQLRAVALHHVDAPWRPADVEQRNGRIIRQGNANDEVAIFQYATERSTDAKFWEAIARKAKFIRQLMRGSLSERVVEDIGEIKFDADEASALVAGDPHLIAQAQIKPIVKRLRARFNAHQRSQEGFKRAIREAGVAEEETNKVVGQLTDALGKRKPTRGEDFNARIGKTEFAGTEGREDARKALNTALRAVMADGRQRMYDPDQPPRTIGQVGGLDITAKFERSYNPYQSRHESVVRLEIPAIPGSGRTYLEHELVDVDDKPQRLPLMRVEDEIAGIEGRIRRHENVLADKKRAAAQASGRVGRPFELAEEFDKANRQLEILNEIMRLKAQPPGGEEDNNRRSAAIKALDAELRAMLGEEEDILAQVSARDVNLSPKTPAPPAITQDDKGRVKFVWPTTEARNAEREKKLAAKREAFLARTSRRQQDAPAQPDALGMNDSELTAETERLAGLISRDEASEADVVRHAGLEREQQRRAKNRPAPQRPTAEPTSDQEQEGDAVALAPEQVRSDLDSIAPEDAQREEEEQTPETAESAADSAAEEPPAEDAETPQAPETETPAAEPKLSSAQAAALESALNSPGPDHQVDGPRPLLDVLVRHGYAEERRKPSMSGRGRQVVYYVLTPEGKRRAEALRDAKRDAVRSVQEDRPEPAGIAGTGPQAPTPAAAPEPAAPRPAPRRERGPVVRPFATDGEWRAGMAGVEGAEGAISRAAEATWGRFDGPDAVRPLREAVFEALADQESSNFEDAAGSLVVAREAAQSLRSSLGDGDRESMDAPLADFQRIVDDYLARHAVTVEKRRREDAEQGRAEREDQERFRRSLGMPPSPDAATPEDPAEDAPAEDAPAEDAPETVQPQPADDQSNTGSSVPRPAPEPAPAPEPSPEPPAAAQRPQSAPSDARPVPVTPPADMDGDQIADEVDSLDERLSSLKDATDPVDLAYRLRLEQRRFQLEDEERRRWTPTPEYDEDGKVIPRLRGEVIRDRLAGYGLNDAETRGLAHRVEDLPAAKPGGYSDEEWARIDAEASARESYPPTDEQRVIIEGAARRGLNMSVMALAGTGKSSTLKMLSHRLPGKKIVYLAFNRSVAAEAREAQARGEYAKNLTASTANGYAAKVADKRLNNRLPSHRRNGFKKLSAQQIADRMRWYDTVKAGSRDLSPGGAATVAERMIQTWAKSADEEMQPKHITGAKTAQERRDLFDAVKPLADRMWANLSDPTRGDADQDLTMDFDYIVKMWAVGGYKIDADTLFWDEAQDVNPVMEGVVRAAIDQGVQVVAVGDSNQAIYGFRGAADALGKLPVDARATLTQSFRFGPAIADVGNRFLRLLGTRMRLKGFDRKQSRRGNLKPGDETMVIARTNAGVALAAVQALAAGRTVAVSGGVKDLQEFVQAARALANGDRTDHAELARFNGMAYEDILEEVKGDPDLTQLKSLFDLLEKHSDEIDTLMESGARAAETENVGGRVWVTLDWNDPKTDQLKRWLGDAKTNGVGKLLYDPATRRYFYEHGKRNVPWKNERSGRNGVHKVDNKLSLEEAQQKIDAHLAKLYPQDDTEGGRLVPEDKPHDVLVTTAHKSKGLESERVRIADDFRGPEYEDGGHIKWDTMPDDEALRVAYVAVTRATDVLDSGSLGWVFDAVRDDDPTQPPTGEYRRDWVLDDFKPGDRINFLGEDGTPNTGTVGRIDAPGMYARYEVDGQEREQWISPAQVQNLNGQNRPLLPVASDEELDQAIAEGRYPAAGGSAPVSLDAEEVRTELEGLKRPGQDTPDTGATAQALEPEPEREAPASSEVPQWGQGDWVVTPNGEGRVILAEDGEVVVLDGGGAPRTYEPRQLSRPGEARTAEHDAPTARETARAEKRQRDLEAAQSPEGLELFYGGRLANLDLDEGHGQVLDEDGNRVGWIRRRGTVWHGQDARGGTTVGGTAESASDPLHAPREAAQAVDNGRGDDEMRVPLEDRAWRHLRPEEGRDEVRYSDFSNAQREQFFKLVKQWQKSSDPELSDAAKRWGTGLTYRQMQRLAQEFTAAADNVDTSTPEGRRNQKVLQRAADKLDAQARRSWSNWQTMPPPGEPDVRGNYDNADWVPYGHRDAEGETPAGELTPGGPDGDRAQPDRDTSDDFAALRSRYNGDMVPASEIRPGNWVHAVAADPAYNRPMHMVGRVIYATPLSTGQVRIEVESHVNLNGKDAVRTEFALFSGSTLVERLPEGNPGRGDTSDLEQRIENHDAQRFAARERVPAGWKSVGGSRIQPRPGDRYRIVARRAGTKTEYMDVTVEGPADREGEWRVKNQPMSFRASDIVAVPDDDSSTPGSGRTDGTPAAAPQATPEPSSRYGGDVVDAAEIREGDWVSADSDDVNGMGPGRAVGRVTDVQAVGDQVTLNIVAKNPRGTGTTSEQVRLGRADRVERLPEGNPGREDTSDLAQRLDALKERKRQARVRVPEGWTAISDPLSLDLHPGDHVRIRRGIEQGTGRTVYKDVVLERTWHKEGDDPDDPRWVAVGDSFAFKQSDIVAVPEDVPDTEEHDNPDDDERDEEQRDEDDRRRRRNRPNGGIPNGGGLGGPGLPGLPGLPNRDRASSGTPGGSDGAAGGNGPEGGRRPGRQPAARTKRTALDSQGAARHFGSAAKLQELAGQADVIPDISGQGPFDEVWLNGRKIGSLVEARDGSGWTPFGKFVEVTDDSPRFQDRNAAVAELVRQAQEHGDIPTDRLLPSMPLVGSVSRPPESLPGQSFTSEELERYQALRSLLDDLHAGRSSSGNVADDISRAIDELGWVTGRGKLGRDVYWKPEADAANLRRLLDTVQPDNPRAAHHVASRDRAAWKALTELESSGTPGTPTPVGQLQPGDVVRVTGQRPSWDLNPQSYSGYVRRKRKVTRTRNGQSEKLWELQLGGTPWTRDESMRVIPQHDITVHVPADAAGDLLARADDVDMQLGDYVAPGERDGADGASRSADAPDAGVGPADGGPANGTDDRGGDSAPASGSRYAINSAHLRGERRAGTVEGRRIPTPEEMEQYESGADDLVTDEGLRALFGSPEQVPELAAQGFVPGPKIRSDVDGEVWRNGRLIGRLRKRNRDGQQLWAGEMPLATYLHQPYFTTRDQAVAYLVVRDLEQGEPDLSFVHPDIAWHFANTNVDLAFPPEQDGLRGLESLNDNPADMERYRAIRDSVDALGRGQTVSGNVADDLDHLHDELRWLEATHYKHQQADLKHKSILGPGWLANEISEYLDVLRPEDPRAMHHKTRQDRAGQQFLDTLKAEVGESRAESVPVTDIRRGDVVHLQGRLAGQYSGATGNQTGFVVGEPTKATFSVAGKRHKALRIVVGPSPLGGHAIDRATFIIPVGENAERLVRADDVALPLDDHTYGRRVGETPDVAADRAPDASTGTSTAAPDGRPAAGDRQGSTAGDGQGSAAGAERGSARGEQSTAPKAPAPAADRPARTGGEQRQRPESAAAAQSTSRRPEPAEPRGETTPERPTAPEPIGGRPAEWVQISDVGQGDLVRVDGITKTGTPRTLAGYVVGGPELVPTVRARKVQGMFRVLISDEPDGSGKRSSVWMAQDAAAARATRDGADMFEGAPQSGAASDVLTGRIADQVGTDASGNGLFPGSLVTDHDGNEGVVVGSTAGSARVQFGDSRTDDTHSPTSLTVTDGGAARPAGWTADGHRVNIGSLVGDREGDLLGTVEEVDGDTATVATPDGMTPMPISGLRVIGRTADDASDDKVSRVETVSAVNPGDVLLLPGPNGGRARAYRVTDVDRDGIGRILLQDVVTGEPDNIPGGGPEDTDGRYERLVDRDGSAPDLGPEDAPAASEPVTTREPAPAVDPVDGPTVDPVLSPEERDAIADRGTAPGDDPEAQQAAARIGQDLPVTPEQAQALAEGLREGADTSTPEGRAARRAADHLDQAAGRPGTGGATSAPESDVPEGRPEPSTVGEVGTGDTIALPDETDPDTMSSYRVVDIADAPGGVRVLTVEDGDGNRSTRALTASDPLYQLPEAGAPAPDPDPRDPNPGLDRDAFRADYADLVARAVVDSAIDGTATPGSIHQLRQQIAEKVTPEAMRSALRRLRQDAVAIVDGSGITGEDRDSYLAELRRAAMQSRIDAVRAAVRTLDDLEPLDGESPEDTAQRAAELLRLIPESLRNRPAPSVPDRAAAAPGESSAGEAAARVADEVSTHVDDTVGAALHAADTGPLTPERRAQIVQQLAQRMADDRQDTAQRIAADLPEGERPGITAQVVAALAQIARRVVELVAAFLKGLAGLVRGAARAIDRFRKGIARRIRSWPETRRLRRLAAAARALPEPGDGLSLAERIGHWAQLLPAPGRFGQVSRRLRWYRPASRAALAGGQLPQVQDGMRWAMDRAADRGPGRQALRHLAALRAAGVDVDADVVVRLSAAAPELGDDPHGAVRHARRYQERTAARLRDLRAVAAGRNAPDLAPEIGAAALEAQHAQQEADRLHQAYAAALPGAVRAALSQVREMGPGGRDRLTVSRASDAAATRALGDAARYLPRDWLADSATRPLTAVSGDAGAYDEGSGGATVADLGDGGLGAAAHALARHLQRHYPDLLAAQEVYGFTRTHTGRPGARRSALDLLLERLFGGRADQVANDQIVARGLATMFSGDWYRDDDLRAFLLGLLATR
ncbi:UvrD-helicase domain-containing protein [Streptomyces longwoodensis]|uniref:UvrD-helicase domain-containing protein n=1 Tax=Streptomyces longwoodensis TaxID=68231 RepID=UPI00340AFD11